jgi:predicted RNase H-like HicB family nuclease
MMIYWSDEDECWIVDYPELNSCMAHGDTIREAVNKAHEAKLLMLECIREDGEELPKRVIKDYDSEQSFLWGKTMLWEKLQNERCEQ